MLPKKYEVVISGMAGVFPENNNVEDLENSLFSKNVFVTDDDRKWPTREFNVPRYVGKLTDPFKFDQSFFGVHRRLCQVMDVHTKQSLERTFECICDAGVNPSDLSGSKTACIMSSMTSESEYGSVMVSKNSDHAMLGHSRCMQANRISYFFNLRGPSIVIDSSWVGGIQALDVAHRLIECGQCEAAIVGASNLMFGPEGSVHYDGLCRLNYDGKTKSYSQDADGYSRSEAIVTFFLQRADKALRSYGTIVKVLCGGNMIGNAPFPDHINFKSFLNDFYSDVDIDFDDIGYFEGEGCASLKVDAMELNSVEEVLCSKRKKPLPLGSIKSQVGHTESASCFVSLVNALIAFRTGYIPPTTNYTSPNPFVPALKNGKIQIVSSKQPLEGNYVAVNCFGVVSTYGHILLKRNPMPVELPGSNSDFYPKLIIFSGRNVEQMQSIIDKFENKEIDRGVYYLNHHTFRNKMSQHLYRGYIASGTTEKTFEYELIPYQAASCPPIWFVFSGMGSQWATMGKNLMKIPICMRAIQLCHDCLVPKGIDLIHLITTTDNSVFDDILNAFVGIAAIQIALVDLLTEIGIVPDGIIGHSVGELGCSYADGCLTAEQTILAAYARGKASNDATLIKGMMAAVGKGYREIKDDLPDGIEIACHNSSTSCTLSGPADLVASYVEKLISRGVFAKLVNVANIAYHSKNIAPAAPFLLKYLREIMPDPKLRSKKWVSSSVPISEWDSDLAKYCSAEYHTNNLTSYVLFEEASSMIPKKAVTIEIAPHGLLQAIIKRSLSTCINIPLTNRSQKNGILFLTRALGKLYNAGLSMDLTKLHYNQKMPLPSNTGYLHQLLTWEHSEEWIPISLEFTVKTKSNLRWREITFTPDNEELQHYRLNNVVHSKGVFPNSALLETLMEIIDDINRSHSIYNYNNNNNNNQMSTISFQKLKFIHPIEISGELSVIRIQILRQENEGDFEILFYENTPITGKAFVSSEKFFLTQTRNSLCDAASSLVIDEEQLYKYFAESECFFKEKFRNIKKVCLYNEGFSCYISWTGSLIYFLDGVFKAVQFFFSLENDGLYKITRIGELTINRSEIPSVPLDIEVFYDSCVGEVYCNFLKIKNIVAERSDVVTSEPITIRKRDFVPYGVINNNSEEFFYTQCAQLIDENLYGQKKNCMLSVINADSNTEELEKCFCDVFTNGSSIKIESKKMLSSEVARDAEISHLRGICHGFLFISHGVDSSVTLPRLNNPSFVFQWTPTGFLDPFSKIDDLILLAKQDFTTHSLSLYKKSMTMGRNFNCIIKPDSLTLSNLMKISVGKSQEVMNFVVYYYTTFSDIFKILRTLFTLEIDFATSVRFIFLEHNVKFNPVDVQFKSQMKKDLMVNVLKDGVWGTVRHKTVIKNPINFDPSIKLLHLSKVRCHDLRLKTLCLNLEDVIATKVPGKKLGIMEYGGIRKGEPIFGLGKLSEDNVLETDPILCWRKPTMWSIQECTTTPLFYSIAYYIIYLLSKNKNYKFDTLLIHCGHTPFGQAVIQVASTIKSRIFTTCFNKYQKEFIIREFPQVNADDIFILGNLKGSLFQNTILEANNGDGIHIVINPLDSQDLLLPTMSCTSFMGRYFQVGNEAMGIDCSFGLGICEVELGIFGINPENILNLPDSEKIVLQNTISRGLDNQLLKPLKHVTIQSSYTETDAINLLVENSRHDFPSKLMIQKPRVKFLPSKTPALVEPEKKYLIIGSYNGLWYDLVVWLALKGVTRLYIALDECDIPPYIRRRFRNFIKKHKELTVQFFPLNSIKTSEKCCKILDTIKEGGNPDAVLCITGDIEMYVETVDHALRSRKSDCPLVFVGMGADQACELRKMAGYQSNCIVLQRPSFRNRSLISLFDKILFSEEDKATVYTIDHAKSNDDFFENKESYLPSNLLELVQLYEVFSNEAEFIEIPSHSGSFRNSKGVDPIFVIPGFKINKIKQLISKISYPAFLAVLPERISSIDSVALQLAKFLNGHFHLEMFTIMAETWSGALALNVCRCLERMNKSVELIMIDAAPKMMKEWRSVATPTNNILSKYVPANLAKLNVNELRSWSRRMSELMARLEPGHWDSEQVQRGVDCLLDRLDELDNYSSSNFKLRGKIHLFRPSLCHSGDTCGLDEVSKLPVDVHICDGDDFDEMVESKRLIAEINSLILLEYKCTAKPQLVSQIATLDLLLDAKFQTEGLTRN